MFERSLCLLFPAQYSMVYPVLHCHLHRAAVFLLGSVSGWPVSFPLSYTPWGLFGTLLFFPSLRHTNLFSNPVIQVLLIKGFLFVIDTHSFQVPGFWLPSVPIEIRFLSGFLTTF